MLYCESINSLSVDETDSVSGMSLCTLNVGSSSVIEFGATGVPYDFASRILVRSFFRFACVPTVFLSCCILTEDR